MLIVNFIIIFCFGMFIFVNFCYLYQRNFILCEKYCNNNGLLIKDTNECLCEKNIRSGSECDICEKNNTCKEYLFKNYEDLILKTNLIYSCDHKFGIQFSKTFECEIDDPALTDMVGNIMTITCMKKKKSTIQEILKENQNEEMKCHLALYKKMLNTKTKIDNYVKTLTKT